MKKIKQTQSELCLAIWQLIEEANSETKTLSETSTLKIVHKNNDNGQQQTNDNSKRTCL